MADPITMMALASAATTVVGGVMESKAAKAEAAQHDEERRTAQVAAQEEEVQRRRMLEEALGNQNALRAARGQDMLSGTGAMLRSRELGDANADLRTIRINSGTQDRRLSLAASAARTRGTAAIVGSVGQAAGSLTSFARRNQAIG